MDDDQRHRPEVSRGMVAAHQRGVHIGRPRKPVPASAYRAAKLRHQGLSWAQIAAQLDAEGVPTLSGTGKWNRSSVRYLLNRLA